MPNDLIYHLTFQENIWKNMIINNCSPYFTVKNLRQAVCDNLKVIACLLVIKLWLFNKNITNIVEYHLKVQPEDEDVCKWHLQRLGKTFLYVDIKIIWYARENEEILKFYIVQLNLNDFKDLNFLSSKKPTAKWGRNIYEKTGKQINKLQCKNADSTALYNV